MATSKGQITNLNQPKKKVLVIGIDVYGSKSLEDLPSCKKDAEYVYELLSNLTIFQDPKEDASCCLVKGYQP